MKGFAATPIIFIAVFLITTMLFIHFLDIDKQVAEGVGKEARLRKLQAEVLKNQSAGITELQSCMLWSAQRAYDKTTLEKNISYCLGTSGVNVHAYSYGFSADYSYPYRSGMLIDAFLNGDISVSERMSYPFFELTAAADNFANEINGQKCTDVINKYNNFDGNSCTGAWFTLSSTNIYWCGMPTNIDTSCGSTCSMTYFVAGNNMTGYPLTLQWHQVYKEYTGLNCVP
jgi:hypothetical protein